MYTYYIIPINKKRKEMEGEGKERDFLFCFLYDSGINIHVFMLGNYDELHVYMMGRLLYVLFKLFSNSNCSILLLERICIGIACYPILLIYQ